jgi:hypothetical protein
MKQFKRLAILSLLLAFVTASHPPLVLAAEQEEDLAIHSTSDASPGSTVAVTGPMSSDAPETANQSTATLIRTRPVSRPYQHPPVVQQGPEETSEQLAQSNGASPGTDTTREELALASMSAYPRLDDPVLRWLPEIMDASAKTLVPAEIIAGMIRVESVGDPNIISPAGARGLMQVMDYEFASQLIPEYAWHDPATNVIAGSTEIAKRLVTYGNYRDAVGAYFGFGCDVFGTCTDLYIAVVMDWAAHYASIIANPYASGLAILGPDWSPPPIAPFVVPAPDPPAKPPVTEPLPATTDGGSNVIAADSPPAPAAQPEPQPTAVPTAAATAAPHQPPFQPIRRQSSR